MILHADIPTRLQVDRTLRDRDPTSVSTYSPIDSDSVEQTQRIEFGKLTANGVGQLRGGALRATASRDPRGAR
jgi:hypothetical protein